MFIVLYQFYGENTLHKMFATESEAHIFAWKQMNFRDATYADIYHLGEMLK